MLWVLGVGLGLGFRLDLGLRLCLDLTKLREMDFQVSFGAAFGSAFFFASALALAAAFFLPGAREPPGESAGATLHFALLPVSLDGLFLIPQESQPDGVPQLDRWHTFRLILT